MKAFFCDWAGTAKNAGKIPDWFQHKKVMDITWDEIKMLYTAGFNVVLIHTKKPNDDLDCCDIIVGIDDRSFGQR